MPSGSRSSSTARSPRGSSSRSTDGSISTSSCRSGPLPELEGSRAATASGRLLGWLAVENVRGYELLTAEFGGGPQLVWGPNAAGKTTLIEAIVVLARGHSHRTAADSELIRWGADRAWLACRLTPDEPSAGSIDRATPPSSRATEIEIRISRHGEGGARKRITVNGLPRRATALGPAFRVVVFGPEELLLVSGSPALRRALIDHAAAQGSPTYAHDLSTYTRTVQQRNSVLRAIRDEESGRAELAFWDHTLLDLGATIVTERRRVLGRLADPLSRMHAQIAPAEGRLTLRYSTNASPQPGEDVRAALARRLAETADKEVWNGVTLVGPHRDDLIFELDDREMAAFASRGQQRTAILALKLAELEVLSAAPSGRPTLLLDDVFSELDPRRRAALVEWIADLPQAFVTTTSLADIDPALRRAAAIWRLLPPDPTRGSRLVLEGPA